MNTLLLVGAAMTVLGVFGMLLFQWRGLPAASGASKVVASTGFLLAAVAVDAMATPYGRVVLVALALSFVGDVCLISRDKRWFLAGLVAFLLGHVAYAWAFVLRGVDPTVVAIALAALGLVAALVGRWLLAHVRGALRTPVVLYIAVITAMVALATATFAVAPDLRLLVAAFAFYLSDLAVARERFVHATLLNRLWGLPLYYGAQLLFALTTAS